MWLLCWSVAAFPATPLHGRRSSKNITGGSTTSATGLRDRANDAEDLTQEVFIKMYRTLNSYDVDRGAFMTWVTTITRNLLVDHFRKTKQERSDRLSGHGPSDHEDAMPLSEQIPDRGSRAGFKGTKPGDARGRPSGLAEALPRAAGSCDSKGLTGFGLS